MASVCMACYILHGYNEMHDRLNKLSLFSEELTQFQFIFNSKVWRFHKWGDYYHGHILIPDIFLVLFLRMSTMTCNYKVQLNLKVWQSKQNWMCIQTQANSYCKSQLMVNQLAVYTHDNLWLLNVCLEHGLIVYEYEISFLLILSILHLFVHLIV